MWKAIRSIISIMTKAYHSAWNRTSYFRVLRIDGGDIDFENRTINAGSSAQYSKWKIVRIGFPKTKRYSENSNERPSSWGLAELCKAEEKCSFGLTATQAFFFSQGWEHHRLVSTMMLCFADLAEKYNKIMKLYAVTTPHTHHYVLHQHGKWDESEALISYGTHQHYGGPELYAPPPLTARTGGIFELAA